jgi:hypothetical protein
LFALSPPPRQLGTLSQSYSSGNGSIQESKFEEVNNECEMEVVVTMAEDFMLHAFLVDKKAEMQATI